jgi:hypothetical protein
LSDIFDGFPYTGGGNLHAMTLLVAIELVLELTIENTGM